MAVERSQEHILGRALAVVPIPVSAIAHPSSRPTPTDGFALTVVLIDAATGLPYVASGGGGGGSAQMTATAAAPTYVEGSTTNPLSSNLTGDLRVISATLNALVTAGNANLEIIATKAESVDPVNTFNEPCLYIDIAASQSDVAVGNANDLLDSILVTPATLSPGAVTIGDGATATVIKFVGGTSSVSTLIPFPIDMRNIAAATNHRVSTGANVSVRAFYRART